MPLGLGPMGAEQTRSFGEAGEPENIPLYPCAKIRRNCAKAYTALSETAVVEESKKWPAYTGA
jgi:hypothetical protein